MSVKLLFIIAALISVKISHNSAQKNPYFSENRSVIVHLFEWKWLDIALECERFFQYKGYGGIQVSPPNENVIVSGRPWWERYQPVSYNLTTRSGNESEFADMVSRCNRVGIRIYADVVFNHMAALAGTGTAGNKALSDVKMYPALPFNPQDFHPTCNITNYLRPDVIRNCELKDLRDLDQTSEYVRGKIVVYLNHLIELGVAGFRIDSAKYMYPDELNQIYSKLNNLNENFGFPPDSKPFLYHDVPVFEEDVVSKEEYTSLGVVIEYTYSSSINTVFRGTRNLTNLINWSSDWGFIPNSQDALVFVDNHSNQREENTLTYKNLKRYKMALAFMLTHTYGIPIIMSSYFFDNKDKGPPEDTAENIKSPVIYSDGSCGNGYVCEHRWPQIFNLVEFRNVVNGTDIENWWSSDDEEQIAFSRGEKGFIAISNKGNLTENIQTSLPQGTYCDIISGGVVNGKCSGKSVVIDSNGKGSVVILENDYDGVLVIHVNNKL